MKKALRILLATSAVASLSGCFCFSDLVSWTPFWDSYRKHSHPQGVLDSVSLSTFTRNYLDSGRQYNYKVENGVIMVRINNGVWTNLLNGNPEVNGHVLKVRNIAADNNRVFVVAQDALGARSLWWYCVKSDQAIWSKMLIDQGGDLMKNGYREWTDRVHATATWTNLLELRPFETYVAPKLTKTTCDSTYSDSLGNMRTKQVPCVKIDVQTLSRQSIDVNDIIDIAVGNWSGTVVTYYVLMGSTGDILYIDEEVVMDRWQVVPHLCGDCAHSPYPLSKESHIDASNSVICVSKKTETGTKLFWMRWDFHNKQDFRYWPLDWCEHDWHIVDSPLPSITSLRIDTHWPQGDARDTMWTPPRTAWGSNWKGFLGHLPKPQSSAYPIRISVGYNGICDEYYTQSQSPAALWQTVPFNW